jgi:HD-like signal output (HDOD) protein
VLDLSLRIRQVANDADASVEELAGVIRVEPVLSARVIRMANSVIYNRAGRRVGSVADSIPRIGIANVRVLALIVAMDQLAQEHRSRPMRELAAVVWRHSLDVGAWAYALSRHLHVGASDSALLAGLMTDIGALCLIARVGAYPSIADDADAFADIAALWNGALTHAIVERMGLPADVAHALDASVAADLHWPPASLRALLDLAQLAARSPQPLDREGRDALERRRDAARARAGVPAYDELLAAAAPGRDELTSVLAG